MHGGNNGERISGGGGGGGGNPSVISCSNMSFYLMFISERMKENERKNGRTDGRCCGNTERHTCWGQVSFRWGQVCAGEQRLLWSPLGAEPMDKWRRNEPR